MRLLFTTQPGYGHLFPMVPLAEAAERAGHEVAFATSASFGPAVRRAGFTSLAAGLDWTEPDIEDTFPDVAAFALGGSVAEVRWWLTEVWGGPVPRAMAADLMGIVRSWVPDVLVHEQWELAGALAGELSGVPYAMHSQGLLMSPALWRKMAGPALAALRDGLGLPPDPALRWMHRYCYLDDVPPSLQVPNDLEVVQPFRSVARSARHEVLPPWVRQLPPRPTVYASMGTVFHRVPHLFEAILEALRPEPVNLILNVGSAEDLESFGPQPEGVHVTGFVPQTAILARCDAVISHGGYNTVAEALRQGLPMVLIPLRVDQPINAERCVRLGVARRLLPGEVDPMGIRDSVRAVLEEPGYRSNALRMRQEMEAMPPIEVAVERLEQLALRKSPTAP